MEVTEPQHKASREIVELIATELGKNRTVHAGTAISSCARLAGSFLFRSFNFQPKDFVPGDVVLSNEANEKGPVLVSILGWRLSTMGIDINAEKQTEFSKAESNLSFTDTLHVLQDKAIEIMNRNQLSFEQMAYSCAMATAFIIKECQHDVVIKKGFDTAVYSFIEGSKTYPPYLQTPNPKKKSIFRFWK